MAKLSGVQTVDMVGGEITKISYDGAEYARVDEHAKAGDLLLRVTGNLNGQVSVGGFYKCPRLASSSVNTWYIDEDGDTMTSEASRFVVFRKVVTPKPEIETRVEALESRVDALEDAKPKYRTEKRPAKVGEQILVTGKTGRSMRDMTVGKTYEVVDIDELCGKFVNVIDDVGDEASAYNSVYEVIVEDGADKHPQEIEHKGAKYTLVDRKAQPGDVVVFTENISHCYVNGRAYGPAVLVAGTLHVGDEDGDLFTIYQSGFNRTEANTLVYAPAVEKLNVGDYAKVVGGYIHYYFKGDFVEIRGIREVDGAMECDRITDGKRQVVYVGDIIPATDAEIAQATLPKAGDIVVITANTNLSCNSVGDIGKVGEEIRGEDKARVEVPGNAKLGNWTYFDEMRRAKPAEVAEYKRAVAEAEKPKLKVGDYAKALRDSEFGDIQAGEVVKIAEINESEVDVYCVGAETKDEYCYFRPQDLELVAADDVLFAKLGRKPGEIRKGDIVRGYSDLDDLNYFGKIEDLSGGKYVGVRIGDKYRALQDVVLIAPVESRVDTP